MKFEYTLSTLVTFLFVDSMDVVPAMVEKYQLADHVCRVIPGFVWSRSLRETGSQDTYVILLNDETVAKINKYHDSKVSIGLMSHLLEEYTGSRTNDNDVDAVVISVNGKDVWLKDRRCPIDKSNYIDQVKW